MSGNANEQKSALGRRLRSGRVARALIPNTPQSPLKSPARSGPYQRENGAAPRAAEPVLSSAPLAITMSKLTIDWALIPWAAEPWLTACCEIDPPTVAANPENGPKKGVRNPVGSSASLRAAQVMPASTVT